jgi:HK97 family phage major capsid protein
MAATVNSLVSRDSVEGVIPVEYASEIISELPKQSAIMSRARTVTMSTKTRKQPVMDTLPLAYWVDGDSGIKQTTDASWKSVDLVAEELATIVPVPEAVIADASVDLFSEIVPSIVQAFGQKIDAAAIFGIDKPTSWGTDILAGATAAGNTLAAGTNKNMAVDVAALGGTLASEGFAVNGFMARPGFNWTLRTLTDDSGAPIYQTALNAAGVSGLYGYELDEVANGAWDATKAELIAVDYSKLLFGLRQDITYKVLDQAVITDEDGKVILNLAQQDCVALRVVMRCGFAVANPATPTGKTNRYPAAVLTPKASK